MDGQLVAVRPGVVCRIVEIPISVTVVLIPTVALTVLERDQLLQSVKVGGGDAETPLLGVEAAVAGVDLAAERAGGSARQIVDGTAQGNVRIDRRIVDAAINL